jgi:hypothetical protein
MESVFTETARIEEVIFFMTGRVDYFMALVRENASRRYLAGRIHFSSGERKLFTLPGDESRDLKKIMMEMGQAIAGLYDAQCSHIIFPTGIGVDRFVKLLREEKAGDLNPRQAAVSRYVSLN